MRVVRGEKISLPPARVSSSEEKRLTPTVRRLSFFLSPTPAVQKVRGDEHRERRDRVFFILTLTFRPSHLQRAIFVSRLFAEANNAISDLRSPLDPRCRC